MNYRIYSEKLFMDQLKYYIERLEKEKKEKMILRIKKFERVLKDKN
jgi:hypothetical protein